jgi:hypothetical protein
MSRRQITACKLLLLFLIVFGRKISAQEFNYSVTTDSVAWNELNAQTLLNATDTAWRSAYRIPLGFNVNFLGRQFDSVTVETNGYVVFDRDRNYAMMIFNQLGDAVDTSGHHSVIGYETQGAAGTRVTKIQYLNCGENGDNSRMQSWQVWIHENGTVEFRIGPGTLRQTKSVITVTDSVTGLDSSYIVLADDSSKQCHAGLINMNMDTEQRAQLLSGSPENPQLITVTENTAELPSLLFIPRKGYRYSFTPNSN